MVVGCCRESGFRAIFSDAKWNLSPPKVTKQTYGWPPCGILHRQKSVSAGQGDPAHVPRPLREGPLGSAQDRSFLSFWIQCLKMKGRWNPIFRGTPENHSRKAKCLPGPTGPGAFSPLPRLPRASDRAPKRRNAARRLHGAARRVQLACQVHLSRRQARSERAGAGGWGKVQLGWVACFRLYP